MSNMFIQMRPTVAPPSCSVSISPHHQRLSSFMAVSPDSDSHGVLSLTFNTLCGSSLRMDALLLQYGRIDLIQMTLSADHPVDVPGVLDCLGSLQNSGIAVGDRELFYTWICPTATIAKSNVNYTQIFLDGCASDGVHLREVADSAATKCQDRYRWLQQLKTAGLPMNKQIAAFRPCLCKVWL